MEFAYNFCGTRARWLADAAWHIASPDTYAPVQQCSTDVKYSCPAEEVRGIVVFLHGINSSWWQWRNVATRAMEHPALRNYGFYVPTMYARGNTDLDSAAGEVAEVVRTAMSKLAIASFKERNVVLIGTSMGARVAARVETMLAVTLPCNYVDKFVFVSVAGFFGPTPNAQLAHRIGLPLTWLGYHESVVKAATFRAPHEELIEWWQKPHFGWGKKFYHFYASEQDEVISPVSSALPWKAHPTDYSQTCTEHTVVTGVDHSGMVEAVADEYIAWVARVLAEE